MARIIDSAQLSQMSQQQLAANAARGQERLATGKRINTPTDGAKPNLTMADRADISDAGREQLNAQRDARRLAEISMQDEARRLSLMDPDGLTYHATTTLSANNTNTATTNQPPPTAPTNNNASAPTPPAEQPTPEQMQAITSSLALAIMGALNGSNFAQQAQQSEQTEQQSAPADTTDTTASSSSTTTPIGDDWPSVTGPPPPPTNAQLGDYEIENITAGDDGELTGELDLSAYGLGTQRVNLERNAEGEITGASAMDRDLSMALGDGAMRLEGGDGEAFFNIDQGGTLSFSGQAVMEVAGREITLGQAEATAGRDDAGRRMLSIEGTAAMGGGEFSATVSESGAFSAEMSTDMVGALVPGFDKVTGFLDRIGVSLDAGGGGASVSFDPEQQAFSFDMNGLRGSYNNSTGEVSFGGLSVGAGVSLSLDDVTINTKTGAVSAEVSGGVGVGVSGLEVGVDLAGASFAYDPDNDRITLSKRDGIAAANVTTTVTLDRNASTGLYLPSSVRFDANVDTQLARDVAAGLNQAYSGGMELGKQAMGELNRINAYGGAAVQNFAQGLRSAGADTSAYLNRAAQFTGNNLRNFLSAGAQAGDQMGALIRRSGNLTGTNLNRFLSNASSGGRNFVQGFESTMGMLGKLGGGYTNLNIDTAGGISAKVNVGNLGRMNLSFRRDGGNLIGSGALSLGGFSFNNASVTFNDKGLLTGVTGSATLKTPKLKWHGIGIGSQSLTFGLNLDSKGNINATASMRMKLGWFGRHGIDFTLGTGGIKGKVS